MIETDVFLGRQPIFNNEGSCFGYELLYRNEGSNSAVISDDAKATARVIINLIHNLGFSSIIGKKIGFINIDDHTILSDALLSLPKENFIFEILEYTKMSVAIVEKVQRLYEMGYRFALDDFCCKSENFEYFKLLFPYIDIIKIDLLLIHDYSIEEIVNQFKSYNVKLLAEKVETMEMFERCKQSGFDYYQGYFFEKPTVITGKKIEPSLGNVIDLINTFHDTSDIDTLTHKFSLYPEVTFNLLRYVNSAAFLFSHEITSIKQILILLGPSRLRSWLGLFLYAGTENRLFKEAIFDAAKFRAKMMHDLAKACGKPELADEAFLTGSLSLIDTYLQIPMESIIENIQLSHPINEALLSHKGYLGRLLSVTEKLETSEKIQTIIEYLAPKVHLTSQQLYTIYLNATRYVVET
ncbi:MAG: EAL domain-containing protein [Sulfuricurvum sp.]|jgi:EAL and modified HD-GYP domain-containing signal transduction protein|uniref:EAL and HDOD domain-containing protein n=1 Tax=Sulfuricurvum sp. TaxID=2025608 RepID=UPI0025F1C564|nr:EAL domain-containing protein [Sulfuricurvum sp.]MCK9372955.1 EAL domain-containing protein [Sulfuricurvum sp.]